MPADVISALVAANTRHPALGIFGEVGVNVLAFNISSDDLKTPIRGVYGRLRSTDTTRS
ncbi:potassium-transporting ATPase subunit C [Phyllobacterium sp. OV277]|uniref:potassium-transporting ATPase subunit C n=1 Tax=Phyllobacterium sp. OV277 TaxID=1882772 RepID=UPI001113CFB3|nr:potassium-transporting ATPase subunit C [Phyllobacterium sp. OV277]